MTTNEFRFIGKDTLDEIDLTLATILTDNAREVLQTRYLDKDADGIAVETPAELIARVASAVASGEGSEEAGNTWAPVFGRKMAALKFLPNSPTLVNAGKGRGCLSACFVVSPEDDMASIMEVASDAAMIEKWGGGIGFSFSALRPEGDAIRTTHGEACGPIAVMKLYSQVGATLTQGAFRLGAHMGQMIDSHPDIRKFIHCKDDDASLQNFNISVQVTDEFMQAVERGTDWDLINPHGGAVVETVSARELWREICESAWKTGDPGIAFMDRVWETAPNPQMGNIQTSNPCVTGDTLVYTGEGLVRMEELVGECPALALDSRTGEKSSFATKVWSSGVKRVFRLGTKEGYSLRLTADHEVFTTRGKIAAKDLEAGDQIRLLDHKGGFGAEGTPELGMVLGWLTGDGHIDPISAVLSSYGEDLDEVGPMMSAATQTVVAGTGLKPTRFYPAKLHMAPAGRGMVNSVRLKRLAREHGLQEGDWHHVPDVIFRGTEETQRAYLRALFGADGSVSGISAEKGVSVRLNSSYPELLEDVQRMVLNFGIASRICHRRDKRVVSMPDGKGGKKGYHALPDYELVVSKDNVARFAEELGFLTERKNVTLMERMDTYRKGFYRERFLATFEMLEPLGEEEVYDLTEPMTHSFVANGFTISNCGEEWLENYGNCCLGSINLAAHIKGGAFDWDELADTVRMGIRFLDDVINVNEFPLPKLREVNLATRRVGLGIMGWADALVALGIPYDSDEATSLALKVGSFIREVGWKASERLAEERGPFPEYENSRLKKEGMPPVRNSSIITIAPTGTISRLAGVSSGIEPHFSLAWHSNVLWQADGAQARLLDGPNSIREIVGEEGLAVLAEPDINKDAYLLSKGLDPSVFATSMTIGADAHVKMQAAWQKNVTNAVSKTVNLPNDATVEDVDRAYRLAYRTGCKSITVYRDGSKSMQVLETGPRDEAEEEEQQSYLVEKTRPVSLHGITDRVRTGHGNMFVNLTFDPDEPEAIFEVFTTLGKAGGCDSANIEGLSRMVSLALRSGIDPQEIIDQLKGITCCPAWDGGELIRSAPDAIGYVLANHLPLPEGEDGGPDTVAQQHSMFTSVGGGANGSAWPTVIGGHSCPKCYSTHMVMQEGCPTCQDCGYSKCG